jgi:hypothetical protein
MEPNTPDCYGDYDTLNFHCLICKWLDLCKEQKEWDDA